MQMDNTNEFRIKAEEILNFIETYGVLNYSHLEKFFPNSTKKIDYLIKNKRLFRIDDGSYISADQDLHPDKTIIAATGVLGDVFAKVSTHSRAMPPVQVSFMTNDGDYYEIIYVRHGMEVMISTIFENQGTARKRIHDHADTTKRIIIVEDKSQMQMLHIPGTMRFALVQPDGSLTYYNGS
jgi:hypothetical protein